MLQQNQEYQKHVATIIKNIRNMQPLTQKKNGMVLQLSLRIFETCSNYNQE